MANNFTGKDGAAATQTFKSTDTAGVHVPHKNIDVAASGFSVDIGAVADSAITTDTTGSLSAKLRGLVKWAFERMPASLGQKAMAASLPVVLASDQTGIPLTAGSSYIGAVKDNGPYWTPSDFIVDSANASAAPVDLSAAPTSGEKIVIDDLEISVGSTGLTVAVKEETTGVVLYKFFMAANTTVVISPRNGRKLASVDKKVQIQTSASGDVFAHLGYHSG